MEGLQIGGGRGFPYPERGWGHPEKSPLLLPPLHLRFHSNQSVGGRGRGSPSVFLPSPSNPGSPGSQRPSQPGHARARTDTPAGLTIAHTPHIHSSKQRVWTPLSPPAPPSSRRGRGIPSPAPLQGKLRAASCGGEGNLEPWRDVARMEGVSRLPQKAGPPPRSPPRASGLPPDCGGCGEDPGCRGFPGRRRSLSLASRLELTGPS